MEIEIKDGLSTTVDRDVYELIKEKKLHISEIKYKNKVVRKYVRFSRNGKDVYLHRYILNAKNGYDVDHKDNNPLNNKRSNLRLCSKSQNGANRNPTNKTSKYKGVSKRKNSNLFRAQITKDGRTQSIGHYKREVEAAKAYDKKAIELHGEFARTNKDLGLI